MVLMLNPRVGEMVEISSPLIRFTMVVFPALSRPTMSNRISFSLALTFLMMVRSPMVMVGVGVVAVVVVVGVGRERDGGETEGKGGRERTVFVTT